LEIGLELGARAQAALLGFGESPLRIGVAALLPVADRKVLIGRCNLVVLAQALLPRPDRVVEAAEMVERVADVEVDLPRRLLEGLSRRRVHTLEPQDRILELVSAEDIGRELGLVGK